MLTGAKNTIRKIVQRKRCIDEITSKTGLSRKEVAAKADETVKTLGISYRDYVRLKYYRLSPEEQQKKFVRVERNRNKKDTKAVENVMNKTGWSYEYTEKMILDAQKRTGCTYTEYFIYRFYEMDEEEQAEVFLIENSRKLMLKYDVDKEFSYILTDKGKTNEYFEEYLNRPWCVNTRVSQDEFFNTFAGIEKVIYKPIDGNRGKGIKSFKLSNENIKDVYNELSAMPEGVVEAFVVQHPEMSSLNPDSVNTVRIVSISSNRKSVTKGGKNMDIAYAALRIGNGNSVVDNFHSGGMAASIDMATGQLNTAAADMNGNVFDPHPVTGTPIKGFKVPYFDEAVNMVKEAIEKNKIEGYLGWDIAISENGPVLIEVNVSPGVVLLSMPYATEKIGMRKFMEKYL